MEFLILFLLFLGTISFYIIKGTVSSITKTPIWLLWLALMSPALIWTAWLLTHSEDQNIPPYLIIISLFLSPLLYFWLIEIGKTSEKDLKKASSKTNPSPTIEEKNQPEKKQKVRPISNEEEKDLRDCFPWSIYYLQKIDYFPQAIICRGKLRTVPESAYNTVKDNIEKVFSDRYLILFQETLQGKPFFALVPNPNSKIKPKQKTSISNEQITRPWLALSLLFITAVTTTFVGAGFVLTPQIQQLMTQNENATFYNLLFNELVSNPELIWKGLPYGLGLIVILGIHELSHYLFAIYYRIKATLPYFIPIPFFLGTFGAFISIKSHTPHRKALFDVAIAGPLGGLIATIPVLVWGLALSDVVPMPEDNSMLNFNALDPRFSSFLAIISKVVLGSQLTPNTAISLHPAAIAGYIGLIITALNLMPVGQLDGGHIVHAMFGQGKAIIIGQVARLLVFLFAFVRQEFLIWAIILLFMPLADQPALNDVTELDNTRDFLGLISLVLLIFILLPLPSTVAQLLNF